MKTHTLEIEISTKKGDTQKTRWLVVQDHPWPRIHANGGGLGWDNYESLFPRYGQPAAGIGQNYHCYLLSDTAPAEIPDDYSRNYFAGYTPYTSYTQPKQPTNGGAFTIRGNDCGETTVEVTDRWTTTKVRGGQTPTATEKEIIEKQITPVLLSYIAQHRASLKTEAVAAIRTRFAQELAEAREQLQKLDQEAKNATY